MRTATLRSAWLARLFAIFEFYYLIMKKNNSPTINTNGLRIEELFKLNSNEFNQKEESGVTSRIKKIK